MELNNKMDIINRELTIENNVLIENMQRKDRYIESLEKQNRTLQENLDSIIYSRSYKAVQKIKRLIKRR